MKLSRPHGLEKDEAIARLRILADYWASKYGVQIDWAGDDRAKVRGKVKGIKFDGEIVVDGGAVTADIEAGFLAERLGGRQYVEGKLDEYLNPSISLDDLRNKRPS